jgi:serine/threonine-protein kinase
MLGVGGMGRVYLAEDERLGVRVAIKVLRETLSRDPGSVMRLIAEAKLAIQLAHPNVVRVDHFEDGEMLKFLVMEYIEGETLAHRIAGERKLPEGEVRRIAIEVCKGLEHAHHKRVIHRDIKPGNILLAKNGEIKIADFGIARECRDSVSRLTSQVDSGTLLYMSPEQLIGKSNEVSDVYSLGIVVYEMVTGQPPFRSGDIPYQIREIVPDPPAGVSPELGAIVPGAWRRNRSAVTPPSSPCAGNSTGPRRQSGKRKRRAPRRCAGLKKSGSAPKNNARTKSVASRLN